MFDDIEYDDEPCVMRHDGRLADLQALGVNKRKQHTAYSG